LKLNRMKIIISWWLFVMTLLSINIGFAKTSGDLYLSEKHEISALSFAKGDTLELRYDTRVNVKLKTGTKVAGRIIGAHENYILVKRNAPEPKVIKLDDIESLKFFKNEQTGARQLSVAGHLVKGLGVLMIATAGVAYIISPLVQFSLHLVTLGAHKLTFWGLFGLPTGLLSGGLIFRLIGLRLYKKKLVEMNTINLISVR